MVLYRFYGFMGGGSGLGVSRGLGFGFRGLSLGGWVLALRLFGTSFCQYAFSAFYFFFPRRFFPMVFDIFPCFSIDLIGFYEN